VPSWTAAAAANKGCGTGEARMVIDYGGLLLEGLGTKLASSNLATRGRFLLKAILQYGNKT